MIALLLFLLFAVAAITLLTRLDPDVANLPRSRARKRLGTAYGLNDGFPYFVGFSADSGGACGCDSGSCGCDAGGSGH